jgi:hypothetical protein
VASCRVTVSLLSDGPYTANQRAYHQASPKNWGFKRNTDYVILTAERAFCPQSGMSRLTLRNPYGFSPRFVFPSEYGQVYKKLDVQSIHDVAWLNFKIVGLFGSWYFIAIS